MYVQGESLFRVGRCTVSSIVLEWSQIDEVVVDVIQQPSIRLTVREEVWITPMLALVFQDGLKFRYFMYQTKC
jgi:hypothetical protein